MGEVSVHCKQLISVQDKIKKCCYFKCNLLVGDLPFYHSLSKYLMTELKRYLGIFELYFVTQLCECILFLSNNFKN